MKKGLCVIVLIFIASILVSCGGSSDAADAANGDPINGIWVNDDGDSLVIDGIVGYLEEGNSDRYCYWCDVNLNKQTITIKDYGVDDTNPLYNYVFVNDTMVLETKSDDVLSDKFTFELSEQELGDSSDAKLDGDWYFGQPDHISVLSIDGENGLLSESDLDPYKCEISQENKTIRINEYNWDQKDLTFQYVLINHKLLLNTNNNDALDSTILLRTKEEFEALPKPVDRDDFDDADFDDVDDGDEDYEDNEDESDDLSSTVFSPQDVSDKTIESIRTYGDYLAMYKKIIDDYFANYESVIKGTALYSEESFQEMKDGLDEGYREQEELYGSMKNKKIIGKDDLVQFLKDYRDELKEYTDSLEAALG